MEGLCAPTTDKRDNSGLVFAEKYFDSKSSEDNVRERAASWKCQSILLVLLASATVFQACYYLSQINSIYDRITSLENKVLNLQALLDIKVGISINYLF